MKRVYLDTSAYLSVLLGAKDSTQILSKTKGKILCSSTFLLLESERNLVNQHREKMITAKQYDLCMAQLKEDSKVFIFKDLTPDLCLSQKYPISRTPRSADLVHIRTAEWFIENGGIYNFISLDKAQLLAARDLGIPTS